MKRKLPKLPPELAHDKHLLNQVLRSRRNSKHKDKRVTKRDKLDDTA